MGWIVPYGPRLSRLLLVSLGTLMGLGYGDGALAGTRFTDASLRGDYAIIDIARGTQPPQAGVGVAHYDGNGKFSGRSIQDVPAGSPPAGGDPAERMFVQASITGTYTVNTDGTGTSTLTITLPGIVSEQMNLSPTNEFKVDPNRNAECEPVFVSWDKNPSYHGP